MSEEMSCYCCQCYNPAIWIRCTELSGDYPFCQEHAEQEKDFGTQEPFSFFWRKIPQQERASKHPDFIQKWNIYEDEFPELARRICNMRYDQAGKFFRFCVEAFKLQSDDAFREGRYSRANSIIAVANALNTFADSLETLFAECEKK